MNRLIRGLGLWLFSLTIVALPPAYGPTSAKEDLWHVAKTYQQDTSGTTVQQWMLALFRTNSQAFKHNNMNGLMAGYTLKAPPIRFVSSVSDKAAEEILHKHNVSWKQGGIALIRYASAWPFSKMQPLNSHVASLDKRVSELSRSFEALQIHLESRYSELTRKAHQVQQTLAMINSGLTHLQGQGSIGTSKNTVASNDVDWYSVWGHTKSQWFAPTSLRVASAAAFLLILMMIWVLSAPHMQPLKVTSRYPHESEDEEDDLSDEYDFMSSAESIPARLDLARAYMDMDDLESARDVLEKVLANCSESRFVQKAKVMLASLD